jgi:hypothetical protein
MKQFTAWPPPAWTECVITWDWILESYPGSPNDIYMHGAINIPAHHAIMYMDGTAPKDLHSVLKTRKMLLFFN